MSSKLGVPPDYLTLLKVNQTSNYVNMACLCLCVWDWIISLPDEIEIGRRALKRGWRCAWSFIHAAYILSRVTTLALLAVCIMLDTFPFKSSCVGLASMLGLLYGITSPAAALLFYSRATAVYLRDPKAKVFFGLCWLALLACFLADGVYAGMGIGHLPSNGVCGLVTLGAGAGSSYIALGVFDTVVYVAISWRLATLSVTGDHWRARVASLATGAGLSRLARSMLQSGQRYYFSSMGITVTLAVFSRGVSPYWRDQFVSVGIVFPTVMACRLFRGVSLGRITGGETLPTGEAMSNMVFVNDARDGTRPVSQSAASLSLGQLEMGPMNESAGPS
ncbi:hypothetical protein HWV62_37410 [Athelia sp. TMB]|nr:hypothetical protein HWV62_37410 [Athelia sp. TMB]